MSGARLRAALQTPRARGKNRASEISNKVTFKVKVKFTLSDLMAWGAQTSLFHVNFSAELKVAVPSCLNRDGAQDRLTARSGVGTGVQMRVWTGRDGPRHTCGAWHRKTTQETGHCESRQGNKGPRIISIPATRTHHTHTHDPNPWLNRGHPKQCGLPFCLLACDASQFWQEGIQRIMRFRVGF